jgi:hypothetical protein
VILITSSQFEATLLVRKSLVLHSKAMRSVLGESTSRYCDPGSSVSIVSGYVLDDGAIEVRSPAEAK